MRFRRRRLLRGVLGTVLAGGLLGAPPASAQDQVPICLATADGRLVETRVDRAQLDLYRNGRNVVPAPATGCPERVGDPAPPAADEDEGQPTPMPSRERRERRRRAAEAAPSRLPDTGAEPIIVGGLGMSLLLVGYGVRLRTLPERF